VKIKKRSLKRKIIDEDMDNSADKENLSITDTEAFFFKNKLH